MVYAYTMYVFHVYIHTHRQQSIMPKFGVIGRRIRILRADYVIEKVRNQQATK